ncbi:Tgl5p [Sugiyamaella lignohabitans]|uniref:Patatin-like phospholipase domain-containing protein n=1 Tax=Sugiyamaella lignohabitans TaxID=796027 RepID=A0A167EIZ6_9ASCO|nr:Tgl5p [Sugiyamaella lignohabitans]ANB14136.1 Tgl5p [Sugiyamaella lignohabitans]
MEAFSKALQSDGEAPHITSQNDWAPVHSEVNPRKKGRRPKSKPSTLVDESEVLSQGLSHVLLRWPIVIGVGIWITFLAIVYAIVRGYVAGYEYLFTWRGKRRKLREELRKARSYQEWTEAATKLDDHLGFSEWKHTESKSGHYDQKTIMSVVRQLKDYNKKCQASSDSYFKSLQQTDSDDSDYDLKGPLQDIEELCTILQGCVKFNFAGTQGRDLYSQCYYGTKDTVNEYNKELVTALNVVVESPFIPMQNKRTLFKHFSKNFGKSALCLSGGACFSYRHFGVVRTLLDNGLLPKIISGTSGGGLVAALVGTRTNAELDELLVPELADKITACWEKFPAWFFRWYKTGARFDAVDWAQRSCWFTMGSMTFLEAFQRTGRILNISMVPADPSSPAILCNYITSPHAVIWSALLASAAVPGILNPVVLMMKTRTGEIVPYSFGNKWKDGSLRTDIPIHALNTYFNVNFSVVSQVNPHISLFFYAPRGTVGRPVSRRKGKGWRGGFLGSALETIVKLEIKKWLQLLRNLNLLPKLNNQDWSNIWLQKFAGTVTVWPKIRLVDFWHILDDPDRSQLATLMLSGERSTYPRLLFIRHFVNIERAIEQARRKVSSRHQHQAHTPLKHRKLNGTIAANGIILNGNGTVHTTSSSPSSSSLLHTLPPSHSIFQQSHLDDYYHSTSGTEPRFDLEQSSDSDSA